MTTPAPPHHSRHPADTADAPVPPQVALLDSILRRHGARGKASLSSPMEDCFLNNFDSIDYDLNPTLVKSTIAIALSPDGSTVATTHGDHTVKIFKYEDASLFRVFEGHPRTPWTVKYHHTNSDIVASGCLGFEIFVWSISENCKVNSIRYSNSIISLSFQPHGPYIAVASGLELRLWNWAENARLSIDGPTGFILQSKKPGSGAAPAAATPKRHPRMKIVRHSRNIRAVLFHPFGRILLAAAPDRARENEVPVVYSRLYAFDVDSIAMPDEDDAGEAEAERAPLQEVDLTALPSLLPQVHLYSDGGLDISADGRLLFVCSILYESGPVGSFLSFDSPDTTDRLEDIRRALGGLALSGGEGREPRAPVSIDALREDTKEYRSLSCLCLYKFNYPIDNTIELPGEVDAPVPGFRNAALRDAPYPQLELLQYRVVPDALLKAITSAKLSPTCRYGLLGYGVRTDNRVTSHRFGFVASEIVSLQGEGLSMAAVMTDEVDEVNIAQFHPLPGGGIIYGTKRGRVRVFKRGALFDD